MRPRIFRRRHRRSIHSNSDSFFQKENNSILEPSETTPFFNLPHQVQAKLSVSQPNEPAEIQADAMADQVVNKINNPSIHRKCAACEQEDTKISRSIFRMEGDEEETVQAKLFRMEEEEEVQAKLFRQEEEEEAVQAKLFRMEEEEEESLQAKSNGKTTSAPNTIAQQIQQSKGSGSQMAEPVKSKMESAFGTSFKNVRIHTNEKAQSMSSQINAQAFTYGNDIYFNKNKYSPDSKSGQHLLAHELTHVVQQGKKADRLPENKISRSCIAGTLKPWSEKVTEMNKLKGKDFNSCASNLMSEALGSAAKVHQSTNSEADLDAAIEAGHYTAWDSGKEINFDANFSTKVGNTNQFGETRTVTDSKNVTTIYIIMGSSAINDFGPAFTQMANQHEQDHAADFTAQAASGKSHSATGGEELRIYTRGFTSFFLKLFRVDTSACTYGFADDFSQMFTNYPSGSNAEKDAAFKSIESFYNNNIKGNSDNEMKFKIWFQTTVNNLGVSQTLVKRINGLSGLGLKKGKKPLDHLVCTTP